MIQKVWNEKGLRTKFFVELIVSGTFEQMNCIEKYKNMRIAIERINFFTSESTSTVFQTSNYLLCYKQILAPFLN